MGIICDGVAGDDYGDKFEINYFSRKNKETLNDLKKQVLFFVGCVITRSIYDKKYFRTN